MVEATLADRDSIRVANEAIAEMKEAWRDDRRSGQCPTAIADLSLTGAESTDPEFSVDYTPSGARPIDQAVLIAADPKLLPGGPRGITCACSRRSDAAKKPASAQSLLRERGDAKFKTVEDLFATQTFLGDSENLKAAFGETAKTIDTPAHTNHTLRIQTLQKII